MQALLEEWCQKRRNIPNEPPELQILRKSSDFFTPNDCYFGEYAVTLPHATTIDFEALVLGDTVWHLNFYLGDSVTEAQLVPRRLPTSTLAQVPQGPPSILLILITP